MSYTSVEKGRRRYTVEGFNITQDQRGHRLVGYINNHPVMEKHFFQEWKALESGQNFLFEAHWTDFFIRPHHRTKRFGKY